MENDATRANAVSERKKSFRKFDFFSFAVWTNVKQKKSVRRRNKKNIAGRIPEATQSPKTSQKAEVITFCIKPLTHYLRGSDLKIGEI